MPQGERGKGIEMKIEKEKYRKSKKKEVFYKDSHWKKMVVHLSIAIPKWRGPYSNV